MRSLKDCLQSWIVKCVCIQRTQKHGANDSACNPPPRALRCTFRGGKNEEPAPEQTGLTVAAGAAATTTTLQLLFFGFFMHHSLSGRRYCHSSTNQVGQEQSCKSQEEAVIRQLLYSFVYPSFRKTGAV